MPDRTKYAFGHFFASLKAYKAALSRDDTNIDKSELIYFKQAPNAVIEDWIRINQAGSYFFILKNDTKVKSKFTLECSNI